MSIDANVNVNVDVDANVDVDVNVNVNGNVDVDVDVDVDVRMWERTNVRMCECLTCSGSVIFPHLLEMFFRHVVSTFFWGLCVLFVICLTCSGSFLFGSACLLDMS